MATYKTSEFKPRGLIVRDGLDTDYLTVAGQSVTQGGPNRPDECRRRHRTHWSYGSRRN